jgi:prepilin-type N-terminal cleavage/methylation domain-containing protein/prepilin-type processing-associated H-X9-DG protein
MKRHSGFSLVEFLVVLVIISFLISLLLPALSRSREAARRITCVNNLKQIALALQTYYTSNEVLPSGATDHQSPDEEEIEGDRISWIASLLPNAEQRAIFDSIDFGRGALDPANFRARSSTLTMLLCPSSDRGRWANQYWAPIASAPTPPPPGSVGLSTYAGVHHDVEAPIGLDDHGVFFRNSRISYEDVTDGLSQTVFIGEIADPSPLSWLSGSRASLRNTGHAINSPSGRANDSDANSAPIGFVGGFGSTHEGGANVSMGDGSVRFLTNSIDQSVLRLLGHRSDGELIDDSDY